MNSLQRIGDVAATYGVSTRTLRYYEEIGLLTSARPDTSGQRYYDAAALARLEQILLLRRLELPIKAITTIVTTQHLEQAVTAFTAKLRELEHEIDRLEGLRHVVGAFLALLQENGCNPGAGLGLLEAGGTLLLRPKRVKKEELVMPNESTTLDHVRIIELKPFQVAYYRAESASPELDAWNVLLPWAKAKGLMDLATTRFFGFNNPNPSPDRPTYGYEVWVTVPQGVTPDGPVAIKEFGGGLYAVTTTYLYEIQERWQKLVGWMHAGGEWELAQHQWLEESIDPDKSLGQDTAQLDLFMPIKRK